MTPELGPWPRVVTLDLWHTLLEIEPESRAPLAEVRERAWAQPLVSAGMPREEAWEAVRWMRAEAERIQSSGESVPIARQARLLEERTGRPIDPAGPAEAIGAVVRGARVRLAPGAAEAIAWLARSGHPLGVVSNILSEPPDAIRAVLERFGLDLEVGTIFLSAEQANAKPSPAPFRTVLAALGGKPEEAMHIGDHSDDVVGALAAGLGIARFTGLLSGYAPESAEALSRIPPAVPAFDSWDRLPERWTGLCERARAAVAAPSGAARYARA